MNTKHIVTARREVPRTETGFEKETTMRSIKAFSRGQAVRLTKGRADADGLHGQIGVCLGGGREGGVTYVVIGWGKGVRNKAGASGSAYDPRDVEPVTKV